MTRALLLIAPLIGVLVMSAITLALVYSTTAPDEGVIAVWTGNMIGAALYTGEVDLYDPRTHTRIRLQERLYPPERTPALGDTAPDGRHFAYVFNANLVIGDDLLGEHFQVTSGLHVDDVPDWSPDGSQIAFTALGQNNSVIYLISGSGSNQRPLTNSTMISFHPDWSPDGRRLAMRVQDPGSPFGTNQVFVIDADGRNLTRITSYGGLIYAAYVMWVAP